MMKHMLQMTQDQIQYQQSKLEQVQQLESQLDICHEQMFKLQQQNNENKSQKNQQIKQQQIVQKQHQIQLKYENLQILYQAIKGLNNNTLPKDITQKFPKDLVIFKLHQKRVTMNQYNQAFEVLKQTINKQEFCQLLQIEPFYLTEIESQQVVDKLTGTQSLSQQLFTQLSYHSLEGLDEQQAQQLINKSIVYDSIGFNTNTKSWKRRYYQIYLGNEFQLGLIDTILFFIRNFLNTHSNNNVTNKSEQNYQSMKVSIDFITNPFQRQSYHKRSIEVQKQDSFIRDLNEQQSNQQVIENFNPNDESQLINFSLLMKKINNLKYQVAILKIN